MSENKKLAEVHLSSAILDIANCLSFPITQETICSIRDEVIEEVVRLSKESKNDT